MKRQQGGEMWKQGADGCIFYPHIQCQEDTLVAPDLRDKDKVSKILSLNSGDTVIEDIIKKRYPLVVQGKGVVIAEKMCTPQFDIQNNRASAKVMQNYMKDYNHYQLLRTHETYLTKPFNPSPCFKINTSKPFDYENHIYPLYDNTVSATIKKSPYFSPADRGYNKDECLKLIRRACNAAVALVSDGNYWVINTDSHFGNIYVKNDSEVYTSLADWGRSIRIPPRRVINIILGLLGQFKTDYIKVSNGAIAELTSTNLDHFLQFPYVTRSAIEWLLNPANKKNLEENLEKKLNQIRICTIYGILKVMDEFIRLPKELFTDLENNVTSQQNIIDIVNMHIKVEGIDKYIDLDAMFPEKKPVVNQPSVNQPSVNQPSVNQPQKGFLSRLFGYGGGKRSNKRKSRKCKKQRQVTKKKSR